VLATTMSPQEYNDITISRRQLTVTIWFTLREVPWATILYRWNLHVQNMAYFINLDAHIQNGYDGIEEYGCSEINNEHG